MRILLLHSVRNLGSLRRTTLNQAFFLLKYAPGHDYTLQCYGHPIPPAMREGGFDAVILDTTFLWYRWARPRSVLADLLADYGFIADWDAAKIALPQDDYDHCEVLDDWLADWRVGAVFTPLADHAGLLYPRCSQQARILPCLTGHVDVADLALAERWSRPFAGRRVDVGYRAVELPAQFGRAGRLKSEIGARFARALGPDSGLVLDISTAPQDILAGDAWLRFLGDSRFTLGAPSGSSLLDRRGLIQDAIRDYLRGHPGAPFEAIETACFPGEDGRVECVGLGPRNIEAALAQSCQILVAHPGLAPLAADVHYIPLDPDCANIGEVRAQMRDRALVEKRIRACRELLLEAPEFGYPHLAERVLGEIAALRNATAPAPANGAAAHRPDPVLSLIEEQRIIVRLAAAELAAAAEPASGASAREAELTEALRRRFGRSGAIREILRINDDIDAHGNIVRTGPWSPGLWLYYRYRQLRSMATLRAGARLLPVRPLRWQGSRARRFAPAAGRRKTATMLVADTAIDRRVLLTARSLQEAGWTVTVIALPFPNWPVARDEDRLAFPDVAIVRLNPRWPVRAPRRGPGLIDRSRFWQQVYPYYLHFLNLALRAPAEIYVAHDLPALPAAATAAEMLGVQLVYDAHELYPEQRVFDADRAALLARAERELIRRPALVTTVNASIAAEIGRRYSIALPEIILNAPAVPPGGLPVPRSNLIRDRLGLDPGARILLFQGGLSIYRNLDTLVAAMRCVATPDVVLVLMGPDGGVRGELQRIAAELGLLGRRVHFLDAVPQTVLLSWTASADIGVIPYPPVDLNSRLCSPNKLFEFIVAEIPILANDLPELRRFVGANGFGQNHPMGDPPALARAIDAMCAADLDRYRAALRRRSAEFVWDGQGRKLMGLYEAVHMAGHAAPVAALAEAP